MDNGYPQDMIKRLIDNIYNQKKNPQLQDIKWATLTYFKPKVRKITTYLGTHGYA